MFSLDPTVIALIATVFGGVGLSVINHFLGKGKTRFDDARSIRDELRIEITNQKEEISKLEADRDKWREDYYKLKEEFFKLQTQLSFALKNIRAELEEKSGDPPKEID